MPLIGVIAPDHKERATDAPGRYPKWLPLADLLTAAETASPTWSPWPYELVKALVGNHQERGDRLSVTTVSGGCMRGTLVERKEDYIASMDGFYASLRGSQIHRTLELSARPGALAEWRFYTDIDGQEISGSPDLITYDTVWDWKTTENPPQHDYMWADHKLQLQFNRFCFNNATKWDAPPGEDPMTIGLDPHFTRIQHLAITYLGPKGPKVLETVKSIRVPNKSGDGTHPQRVPDVWDDDTVLAELRPRMQGWRLAWDSYPTWPKGLEEYPGWAGPPEFRCYGPPVCYLPGCAAKRLPNGLTWPNS